MSSNSQRGRGIADTPDEEAQLVLIAVIALGVVAGSAGVLWLKGTTWLVEHQVLVARSADPCLEVPGSNGAGLDPARTLIAAALIVALVAVAASWARRALACRRREDLG